MNPELIKKLRYSHAGQSESYELPIPLTDSLLLISEFFKNSANNKLCLVYPSKEYVAQWLSIPIIFSLIETDFVKFKGDILKSYQDYKKGDKLILNNHAIVEWCGVRENGVVFKTKGIKESSGAVITIGFTDAIKLRKVTGARKLSPLQSVKEVLPKRNITPIESLLKIDTYGNTDFIKNKICLISKFRSFDDSIGNISVNLASLHEYFHVEKIDENGTLDIESPLLISNNLANLKLYLDNLVVSKIIIDGFEKIQERGITDFSDVDKKNIPTILITDLSEIERFENIDNFGFDFFNFTKENLKLDQAENRSPFYSFDRKLRTYNSFNIIKEICQNIELETATQKIHSIEKDESNNDLNSIKISLIHLTNLISRVAHVPTAHEISIFNSKINSIKTLFHRTRMWLGDSHKPIDDAITLLKSVIEKFASSPSEKCEKLKMLMDVTRYDHIICPTENEAKALNDFISTSVHIHRPRVISVADINNSLLANKQVKAILTGWAKSNNINRIISSFIFSELTILFYQFENKYYNSLQRRNRKYSENIKATIDSSGNPSGRGSTSPKGFDDFYSTDEIISEPTENSFDILEFELKLDKVQYSKYAAKGNSIDSIKAKRIDFENDFFIYSSESHKFLVINELIDKGNVDGKIHFKKLESLKSLDLISFIITDKDVLVELVKRMIRTEEFLEVKKWASLWQHILQEHFKKIGCDFKKLVVALRDAGCPRHEATIRTWLQDDSMIGPEDDRDIISISKMANFSIVEKNIDKIRNSIRQMTGWRMKAADFITDKIKAQIHEFADRSIVNKKILVEGLGSVIVLKVIEVSSVWENIDVKYVNRLLQKEII